ncbi:hypothetical protein EPI10_019959 [Gossypium australe]|uniref:Uncharacterized protein n=1 Tax=Gossypium australe TaxID=47621 RepID=A0A5B6WDE8_9ROSI|nr:hypothetical protein EPI10_019959 [Gossypium australe]
MGMAGGGGAHDAEERVRGWAAPLYPSIAAVSPPVRIPITRENEGLVSRRGRAHDAESGRRGQVRGVAGAGRAARGLKTGARVSAY